MLPAVGAWAAGGVSVHDTGSQIAPVTYECTPGHKAETRLTTLDSGTIRYTFRYSGCVDPSHGELRPSAEGNFGMPEPTAGNWYWGGFLEVLVNGADAVRYRVADMRVTESGSRGAFQVLWAHPDAEVGLRLMLLPNSNHVLAYLVWKPKPGATIKTVAVRLRCYPSFFTAARHRQGERHCQTPRIDKREPETLELEPAKDTYLYYYDAVFDPAKGEGDGPCAAVVAPEGVPGGRVQIGDYAVMTTLDLKPEAGQCRFALYDFTGLKNAEAEAYLKAHAAEDLAQLEATDFRPAAARQLDVEGFKAEAAKLLADAADDGKALQPKVDELLGRMTALKGKADQGDWTAEAELANALETSQDLFWRLRTFAVLNAP
jgi:hypothetical protein